MAGNSSNRRFISVGLENPDGSPNGAAQVLVTLSGLSMKPNGDVINRDVVRPTMSQVGSVIGAKNWDLTIPVEATGGGMDGSSVKEPPMHALLLSCGMANEAGAMISVSGLSGVPALGDTLSNTTTPGAVGTVAHVVVSDTPGEAVIWVRDLQTAPSAADGLSAGSATATTVSVDDALVYRPESDRTQHNTAVVNVHYDGQRRIATRSRGDFSFDWTAGGVCKMQFVLKGLYQSPDNVALPDADYVDMEPPIAQSAGLMLGDYPTDTGTIEKMSFKLGADIVPVPDINSPNGRHSYRIKGRKPTGSIDPEVVALSDFNPFSMWENGDRAALHMALGSTAGERISVVVTSPRVTGVNDKERAGSDTYELPFDATGTDDDEFYLFFH